MPELSTCMIVEKWLNQTIKPKWLRCCINIVSGILAVLILMKLNTLTFIILQFSFTATWVEKLPNKYLLVIGLELLKTAEKYLSFFIKIPGSWMNTKVYRQQSISRGFWNYIVRQVSFIFWAIQQILWVKVHTLCITDVDLVWMH